MPEAKPKLPELLPMNPVPAMELDQFYPGERAVSVKACENFAKLYAADVQREAWNAAIEWAAQLCELHVVQTEVRSGRRSLYELPIEDQGMHAGQTYASAIRSAALPTTEGDTK